MQKSGQDRAKRCTKYLTNLETILFVTLDY